MFVRHLTLIFFDQNLKFVEIQGFEDKFVTPFWNSIYVHYKGWLTIPLRNLKVSYFISSTIVPSSNPLASDFGLESTPFG